MLANAMGQIKKCWLTQRIREQARSHRDGVPGTKKGALMAPPFRCSNLNQNAGNTAPLYFSVMNFFTSGLCSAAASFFMASLSLLSARDTRMFT